MFLIRLDDASEYMQYEKWDRIEKLLDEFQIKPIVGVIPDNKDVFLNRYEKRGDFWNIVHSWEKKGWEMALHGYQHVLFKCETIGFNPVNDYSEFVGESYAAQSDKIERGFNILADHGIIPRVFVAPAHTFDDNTLKAIKNLTSIRIISDTVANDIYYQDELFFVPQQTGKLRNLPLKIVTACYHPNIMENDDFIELYNFIKKHRKKMVSLDDLRLKKRPMSNKDKIIRYLYFKFRTMRKRLG